MSTRNGKIARLPQHIRIKLNRRLRDGEQGEPLLEWLNSQPEVAEVMENYFGGTPINKQSLSQWRLGGYEDWRLHEDACEELRQLAEHAGDFRGEAEEQRVSELVAGVLSVELARSARAMLAQTTDPKERWKALRELLEELAPLRRQDLRATRVQMEQERWEMERERLEKEQFDREVEEEKKKVLAPLWDQVQRGPLAEMFGGGKTGKKVADLILKIQNLHPSDMPVPTGDGQSGSDPVRAGQSKIS